MNTDEYAIVFFKVIIVLVILTATILITREETLQNVCEDKGGLLIKSRCVKVEFIK